jgi:xylulokinase
VYFIGLDVGTSGLKAGVIDHRGNIISSEYWETSYKSKEPSRMEQDVDEILKNTIAITKEIVDKSEVMSGDIGGVVLDGQMGGVIGIDSEFNSITGLDMNLDMQSEKYNVYMHEKFGNLLSRTTCGSPLNGQKILKWKRENPETYRQINKFVTLSGYIAGKMAGLHGKDAFIDYTLLAFFGLENAKDLTWSDELCSNLGIERQKLPDIVNPQQIIGGVDQRIAGECGLKTGTPIFAGAGDQAAGLLGAGLITPGSVTDVSGSSTLLFLCVDRFVPDTTNSTVMYIPSVKQGIYHAFTYINGGGISPTWFLDVFMGDKGCKHEDRFSDLAVVASKLPPGSDNLIFIPYFGGRHCPYDIKLRGGWIGLNWGHKTEHLYRAILEAIAYDNCLGFSRLKEVFPDIEIDEILVTGGGSNNPLWNQIKADVFGKRFKRLGGYEFAIRGCGMIAAYGAGIYHDLDSAVSEMGGEIEGEVYYPDMKNNEKYLKYFDIFQNIIKRDLQKTFHLLYKD